MSRISKKINDRFTMIHGTDHALGFFIQVVDDEFIDHPKVGEGYIFDWDKLFGTTVSHIKDSSTMSDYKPTRQEKPEKIVKDLKSNLLSGNFFNKHQ